jgi:hypothetical protein
MEIKKVWETPVATKVGQVTAAAATSDPSAV